LYYKELKKINETETSSIKIFEIFNATQVFDDNNWMFLCKERKNLREKIYFIDILRNASFGSAKLQIDFKKKNYSFVVVV